MPQENSKKGMICALDFVWDVSNTQIRRVDFLMSFDAALHMFDGRSKNDPDMGQEKAQRRFHDQRRKTMVRSFPFWVLSAHKKTSSQTRQALLK
jgi:hypothetical protein